MISRQAKYIIFVLLTAFITLLFPQEDRSEISIPWKEFKSLTNLDGDQIVLPIETFEKLLVQAGKEVKTTYNTVNGNVIISQSEFKKIVNNMKTPSGSDINPPYDYIITKSVYKGKMRQENTDFSASFLVHILKDDEYMKIPVTLSNTAVEDIKVNGAPALIVSESGYSKVVLKGKGEYRIEAEFSVKSSMQKGPHELYLNINRTPITLFELDIPQPQIDVEIPQANQINVSDTKTSTKVSAVIAANSNITVKWRKRFEVAEKLPPKVYADMNHLISIEDNALKTTTEINYNILHSEIEEVGVSIPDNVNILNIWGSGIGEWQEINKDGVRMIHIPFTYGKKGNASVTIVTEVPLSADGLETAFTGVSALNTIRETGSIGIELNTSAEVIVTENKGLERIAVQTLPPALLNKSAKPLIEGFKYSKHPFQLMLNVKKHRKIGVPMAAVYSANIVTLFTEDGKVVHKLQYNIKNSSKQFLEIKLPENAEVFSVFVNNDPVESSLNDDGKLLVPLIRSNSIDTSEGTFPVEVIFSVSRDHFGFFGSKSTELPALDLFTSQIMWSVYLPNDFRYVYFDSSLEKEELIRGVNFFGDGRKYQAEDKKGDFQVAYDEDLDMMEGDGIEEEMEYDDAPRSKKMSVFRNNEMPAAEQMQQMKAEADFGRQMNMGDLDTYAVSSGSSTGLMPIRIKVPTTGQVYRFAKTIVNPEDPLTFKVYFVQSWVPGTVRALIWLFIIILLYLLRKKFVRLIKYILSKFRKKEVEGETFHFDEKDFEKKEVKGEEPEAENDISSDEKDNEKKDEEKKE